MKTLISILLLPLCISSSVLAQGLFQKQVQFSRADSLRGGITSEREWWDLTYYHLQVTVDPSDSTFAGTNHIYFEVLTSSNVLQIDLQEPMKITRVMSGSNELTFERDGNAYFIKMAMEAEVGSVQSIIVSFEGKPKVSKNPPWDGGVKWSADSKGKPFIATANQGAGASLWWPCKDHMYDEVDSMQISVTVPKGLMDVSNGRLRGTSKAKNGWKTYHWFVQNPINNYGVNVNIGDYAHFSEVYEGERGALDCDYYVLKENLEKAKVQFKDAGRTLEALEHWFGPYPFYEDSYKLVEVPYPGMEHQSSVTYGNGFKNGFMGRDLSETGWGYTFDFIIVHESGHEWFANSITYQDAADMWVHEGFTAYSECLFVEYFYGKAAGSEYVRGTRSNVQNDRPVIGFYGVNHEGSSDMYYKGSNMLHTIRQIVNDDEKWRSILRGLNERFYHKTVTSQEIEAYIIDQSGRKLDKVFDQFLRDIRIPTLEYRINEGNLSVRWSNCVTDFDMPVKIEVNGVERWIQPYTYWEVIMDDMAYDASISLNKDFYASLSDLTVISGYKGE